MATLPEDLISNILQRLPVKSLLRFRCVSKPWNSLIINPKFIQMHLHHSRRNQHLIMRSSGLHFVHSDVPSSTPSDDQAVEIDYPFKTDNFGCELMASCDGLILISPAEDVVCLYNPSTKEFRKLPDSPIEFPKDSFTGCRTIVYGFGFDNVINDYKVIRVVAFYSNGIVEDSEAKVYTLGTDSWRRIGDFPKTLSYRRVSGELVNGRLHWLVDNLTVDDLVDADDYESELDDTEWKPSKLIVSLGIEDEKYNEVPQPEYIDDKYHLNVDVFGGCLCLLANYHTIRTDIWVMRNYGVKESWTRLFTIAQPSNIPSFDYVLPIKFVKHGQILLVKDNKSLILYEPRHGKAKTLAVRGVPNWFETKIYVESLIPLKSGVYVGKKPAQGKKKVKKIGRKTRRNKNGAEHVHLDMLAI